VERGEEISRGLVVTRGDAAVLFEFTEEILDQVARLVERLIELAGRCGFAEAGSRWISRHSPAV